MRKKELKTALMIAEHRIENLSADLRESQNAGTQIAAHLNEALEEVKELKDVECVAESALNVVRGNVKKLMDDLRDKEGKIARLMVELNTAREALRIECKLLAKYKATGVHVWNCPNSPGEPVCVTTDDGGKDGHSVNLYIRDNHVLGVKVYDKKTNKLVASAGLTAYDEGD
jgi:hypothetical protein